MKNETAEMHIMKAGVVKELAKNSTTVNTTSTPVEQKVTFTAGELEILNNSTSIEGHLHKGHNVEQKDVVFTAEELEVLNNPHSIEGHLQKGRGLA